MTTEIKSFSQALPVLAAHAMEPRSIGNRLWQVGAQTLDKGGVIRLARELAAKGAPPADADPARCRPATEEATRAAVDTPTIPPPRSTWPQLAAPLTYGHHRNATSGGVTHIWRPAPKPRARQRHETLCHIVMTEPPHPITPAQPGRLCADCRRACEKENAMPTSQETEQAALSEPPDAVAHATAGALNPALQDCARRFVAAREQAGAALLEMAGALAEARQQAQHGEWYTFLEAIGTSEDQADRLLDIHQRAAENPQFADAIRHNFLNPTTAALLARPSTPPAVVQQVLAAPAPPTSRQVEQQIRQARGGEIAIKSRSAAGFETDDGTAFDDATRRFAALGWRLERHGLWYKLTDSDGNHYATTPDLAPQLTTLATFEAAAAPLPLPGSPSCEHCTQPAVSRRAIGGTLAWRCAACATSAERDDLEELLGSQYIKTIHGADLGAARHRIAWAGGGGGDHSYREALDRIDASLNAPEEHTPESDWWYVGHEIRRIEQAIDHRRRSDAVQAALQLADALAPTALHEIADQLDDATYEALSAYRRARSGVPTLESEGTT